jgi:hypothetical protein
MDEVPSLITIVFDDEDDDAVGAGPEAMMAVKRRTEQEERVNFKTQKQILA